MTLRIVARYDRSASSQSETVEKANMQDDTCVEGSDEGVFRDDTYRS